MSPHKHVVDLQQKLLGEALLMSTTTYIYVETQKILIFFVERTPYLELYERYDWIHEYVYS